MTIKTSMSGATATTPTRTMYRMDRTMYQELESKCMSPDVNTQDTQITAGYKLGVQKVLRLLREGYLVGE